MLGSNTNFPHPSEPELAGASLHFSRLDGTDDARPQTPWANQQGSTSFMVLGLAAFKAFTVPLHGAKHICIGSPSANRQYGETAA